MVFERITEVKKGMKGSKGNRAKDYKTKMTIDVLSAIVVLTVTLLNAADAAVVDSRIIVDRVEMMNPLDGLYNLPTESVIAVVDTYNTIYGEDAWRVTNNTNMGISGITLSFTIESYGNFDDNLPNQPACGFVVHRSSDPTGVSHNYAHPSTAPADFHGWRTLVLTFADFDAGETLVFRHDTDGSIGTTPPNWGLSSGDAFAGNLEFFVSLTNGFTGSEFFSLSGPHASTAIVIVPEPGTVLLLGIGGLALARKRRA